MLNKFTSVALIALANVQSIKGTIDSEQNQLRGAGGSGNRHRQLFINGPHMGGPQNARSSDLYSTIPYGEGLKTVGEKFTISQDDKFDQAPAAGFGYADLLSKKLKMKSKNYAEAAAWAEEHLAGGDSNHAMMIERLVVPTPEQSLVDKELTVIATESIVPPSHPVFCHEAEVNKWFCHESHDTTDITKVTVTTENSNDPSVVWTACHDEEQYWCHIINVGDRVFVPRDKNDNHMNVFPSLESSCDAVAKKLTEDIKTALKDTDVLKNLCQEVDADTIESDLVNVLTTEHGSLCLDQVKVILLENIHHVKSTYNDAIGCVPELTKEKMLIEPYLAATVCGAECMGLAPALISGLHAGKTGKGLQTATNSQN